LRQHKPELKKYPDYYAMLASLEQQTGQQEEAGKYYLALLKLDQNVGSWWFGYALSLEADNQRNLAMQAYRRAINTGNLSPDLMAYAQARMKVLGE
jgi:MSHA biogenesis protein MshN